MGVAGVTELAMAATLAGTLAGSAMAQAPDSGYALPARDWRSSVNDQCGSRRVSNPKLRSLSQGLGVRNLQVTLFDFERGSSNVASGSLSASARATYHAS